MQLAAIAARVDMVPRAPGQLACGRKPRDTRSRARKYLFAAGGSGGHVFPAIAVAEQLKAIDPDAEFLFMGDKDRIEARLVPKYGYAWEAVRTVPFARPVVCFANFINLFRLIGAMFDAAGKMRKFKPDVVLGTGGFVAAPVCFAAAFLVNTPFYLLEPNVLPGMANRALCGYAEAVFTGFKVPASRISPLKTRRIGVPIRSEFFSVERGAARSARGLTADDLLLTVVGGSLGAHHISTMIREIAPELLAALPRLRIEHQTGLAGSVDLASIDEGDAAATTPAVAATCAGARYAEVPFFDDMAGQLAASDLVVSRSGAITCCELLATGTPSVLVPLPVLADGHQHYNALSLDATGAAALVPQEGGAAALQERVAALLTDGGQRVAMAACARENGRPAAAHEIATALYQKALDPGAEPAVLKAYEPVMKQQERDEDDERPSVPAI